MDTLKVNIFGLFPKPELGNSSKIKLRIYI